MCVREIMSNSVVKLNAIMRVGELYDAVANTKHNIFPVERPSDRNFQGTINRHRIAVLLRDLAFGEAMDEAEFQLVRNGKTSDIARKQPPVVQEEARDPNYVPSAQERWADEYRAAPHLNGASNDLFGASESNLFSPLVPWEQLERDYPRYPDIKDVVPGATDRNRIIDLRPYINTSPTTVHESASVLKARSLPCCLCFTTSSPLFSSMLA